MLIPFLTLPYWDGSERWTKRSEEYACGSQRHNSLEKRRARSKGRRTSRL
jgi:hypothetical protein